MHREESQWLPVAPNTNTNNSNNTNTNNNNNTISLSTDEQKERWVILGYFWAKGSKAVSQEMGAFWSYYESLGWKNNKGAAIVNKLAAARMWRPQFETGQVPNGAAVWFEILRGCPIPDPLVFTAYRGCEIIDDAVVVRMAVSEPWLADFQNKCSGLLTAFAKAGKRPECRLERV